MTLPEDWSIGDAVDALNLLVTDIGAYITDHDYVAFDLPAALGIRESLTDSYRRLRELMEDYETVIGDQMGKYRVDVPGYGFVERHEKTNRTQWDKEALLPDVLDTRLFNDATGEIQDETPLEKVLQVWNLGAPRTTALRARGLDPDEYCTVETRPGWTIRTH